MKSHLRRLAATVAIATACFAASAGMGGGIQPAADTAWGAPATEDDTAWGTPPPADPEPEPDEESTEPPATTDDTAWG